MWSVLGRQGSTPHADPALNSSAPTTASVAAMRCMVNRNANWNAVSRRKISGFLLALLPRQYGPGVSCASPTTRMRGLGIHRSSQCSFKQLISTVLLNRIPRQAYRTYPCPQKSLSLCHIVYFCRGRRRCASDRRPCYSLNRARNHQLVYLKRL